MNRKKPITDAPGRFAYEGLDRVIHEKARLSIVTSLATHPGGLIFNDLKDLCALTDGNLSRHLHILERGGPDPNLEGLQGQPPADVVPADRRKAASASSNTSRCWKIS